MSRGVIDVETTKRDKLRDIIRRVMANPENLTEVVEQVALDWFPLIHVDAENQISIIVGNGRKR